MLSLNEFMMKKAGQAHAKRVSRLNDGKHHVSDRPLRSDAPCTSSPKRSLVLFLKPTSDFTGLDVGWGAESKMILV